MTTKPSDNLILLKTKHNDFDTFPVTSMTQETKYYLKTVPKHFAAMIEVASQSVGLIEPHDDDSFYILVFGEDPFDPTASWEASPFLSNTSISREFAEDDGHKTTLFEVVSTKYDMTMGAGGWAVMLLDGEE
jgi:hypothetical protein